MAAKRSATQSGDQENLYKCRRCGNAGQEDLVDVIQVERINLRIMKVKILIEIT